MPANSRKGFLLILVAAAGYGSASIFAKIAYAGGANTLTVLSGRFALASLLLWGYLRLQGNRDCLSRTDQFRLVGAGLLYSTVSLLYFSGLQLLPITVFIILSYTYPALVTLLSYFLLREPLHRRKLSSLLLTTAGCVVMFWSRTWSFNPLGVLLTLCAALTYSFFIIGLSKYFGHIRPPVAMTYMTATSALCYVSYSLLTGQILWQTTALGWAVIAAMALVSTAVASIAFFTGVQLIGASRAALASTIEPVFTIILAMLLFRERISPNQVAGGLLVIGALWLLQMGGTETKETRETSVN